MWNSDWWAKANDFADNEAERFLWQSLQTNLPLQNLRLLCEEQGILMHGCKQSRFRLNFLCATALRLSTCKWLHKHHNFPVPWATFHKIHWRALHLAVQQLALGMCTWQWKFALGCSSVCSQLFKCRHHNLDACPLCGAPNKKASHVLSCPNTGATAKATAFCSTTVRDHVRGGDTQPDLLTLIPKLLLRIQAGTPVCLHLHPAAVCPALKRDISSHSRDKFVVRYHCHRAICNFTRDINE